jgi:hypothetical protein
MGAKDRCWALRRLQQVLALGFERRDMEIGTGVRPMGHLPIESPKPVSGAQVQERKFVEGMTAVDETRAATAPEGTTGILL